MRTAAHTLPHFPAGTTTVRRLMTFNYTYTIYAYACVFFYLCPDHWTERMLTFPPAKINLGLYVVEKRPDGYHNLETVFYPIPLCDTLETRLLRGSNAPYAFQQVGQEIPGRPEDNLVVKVYMAMREEFGLPALDIYLDKHIPTGAGLGGGSSDAAHMMKHLNETFELGLTEEEMERRMAVFGADCPFFIRQRPVLATGIGDVFTPVQLSLKGWTLLLVKPPVHVATRDAYADVVPRPADTNLAEAITRPVTAWRDLLRNDFEASVFRRYPEIRVIRDTLYDFGAAYAAMSGSGSAVFGLFAHPVESAASVFKDCHVFQQRIR